MSEQTCLLNIGPAMLEPYVIGISGGTGSGKSRLASRIAQHFPSQTTIVEQDWYYRDLSGMDPEAAYLEYGKF